MIKHFLSMVERQFNSKVKIVRFDNALEFRSSNINSAYFSSQGIIHQTSYSGTPQQNGVVER